jgi:dihydrofolate reductase
MPLIIIVATDAQRGIGINNTLPWHLPEDLAHFKRTTAGHTIIMGRKTFDSIGRPLPKRRNIVITRNSAWAHEGVESAPSLAAAIALAGADSENGSAYIIGGAQIYAEAMPHADELIVTEIAKNFACDAFFPPIDPQHWQESARQEYDSKEFKYAIVSYQRRQDSPTSI